MKFLLNTNNNNRKHCFLFFDGKNWKINSTWTFLSRFNFWFHWIELMVYHANQHFSSSHVKDSYIFTDIFRLISVSSSSSSNLVVKKVLKISNSRNFSFSPFVSKVSIKINYHQFRFSASEFHHTCMINWRRKYFTRKFLPSDDPSHLINWPLPIDPSNWGKRKKKVLT